MFSQSEGLFDRVVTEDELHHVLSKVDLGQNGQAELQEFIQVETLFKKKKQKASCTLRL